MGTPPIQKIYWCVTEGATASALLKAGGSDALSALQSVSICSGFPYTIIICFMCTSLYWACLHEYKDPLLLRSTCFQVGIWDWTENKRSNELEQYLPSLIDRFRHFITSLVLPFYQLRSVLEDIQPNKTSQIVQFIGLTCTFLLWIIFLIVNVTMKNAYCIGWSFYMFFVFHLAVIRSEVRHKYSIYGLFLSDFFVSMTIFPGVVSQLSLEVALQDIKKQS